jgi:O-antigen/teichoic acid export membrane protein
VKKISYVFLFLTGVFCFYACFRQIFIKNEFDYQVLAIIVFGIVLISLAITGLFYKEGMFEALAKYKTIRYFYVLGSGSFTLTCIILVYDSFGFNLMTFAGISGILFFGFGCWVILFFDYNELYKKYFSNNDFLYTGELEQEQTTLENENKQE